MRQTIVSRLTSGVSVGATGAELVADGRATGSEMSVAEDWVLIGVTASVLDGDEAEGVAEAGSGVLPARFLIMRLRAGA